MPAHCLPLSTALHSCTVFCFYFSFLPICTLPPLPAAHYHTCRPASWAACTAMPAALLLPPYAASIVSLDIFTHYTDSARLHIYPGHFLSACHCLFVMPHLHIPLPACLRATLGRKWGYHCLPRHTTLTTFPLHFLTLGPPAPIPAYTPYTCQNSLPVSPALPH